MWVRWRPGRGGAVRTRPETGHSASSLKEATEPGGGGHGTQGSAENPFLLLSSQPPWGPKTEALLRRRQNKPM